jgi:anhydro-N-acetylmuramic acid kinase
MSRAIGVISGTSMDGIDVALLDTDGDRRVHCGPGATIGYDPALRRELLAAAADAERLTDAERAALAAAVTRAHVGAVRDFMAARGLTAAAVDVVGLHGQTILHQPERRRTIQLGDGAAAARLLGVAVVDGFRLADVAAGGQGAPLAPLYHRALFAAESAPLMVLNLGGVGNVTFLDGDTVIAFDTGPASALLDDLLTRRRGEAFDRDGALAAAGTPDAGVLAAFLADPFLARPPPKSLDRQHFQAHAERVAPLGDADAAATLAAFTIHSVAASLAHVPRPPARWLVTGGGRHNRHFLDGLRRLVGVPVDPIETAGFDGDALEAHAFAYLAVRAMAGRPLSLPSTTGVPRPMPGGRVHPAP